MRARSRTVLWSSCSATQLLLLPFAQQRADSAEHQGYGFVATDIIGGRLAQPKPVDQGGDDKASLTKARLVEYSLKNRSQIRAEPLVKQPLQSGILRICSRRSQAQNCQFKLALAPFWTPDLLSCPE